MNRKSEGQILKPEFAGVLAWARFQFSFFSPTWTRKKCSNDPDARKLVLQPGLGVQYASKIIGGEFVVRVNPQRGSEMDFRLVQIPLSEREDSQTPFGLIIVGIEPDDVFKGFPSLGQTLLPKINGAQ